MPTSATEILLCSATGLPAGSRLAPPSGDQLQNKSPATHPIGLCLRRTLTGPVGGGLSKDTASPKTTEPETEQRPRDVVRRPPHGVRPFLSAFPEAWPSAHRRGL